MLRKTFVAAAALCAACASTTTARIAGDLVHIEVAGRPFATVHTAATPRPFVAPLLGPEGLPRTRAVPPGPGETDDHPHHVSLWFAHGDVNGSDFWQGAKRRERQQLAAPPDVTTVGDAVQVVCTYDWLVGDGTRVASERRTLVFTAHDDARTVDCIVALHATDQPLRLGDTKEGTFAVRVREALRVDGNQGRAHLVNSEGARDAAVWGQRARWIDATGEVDGQQLGLALFDHPQNHAHPTFWHARTYGLLAANPFGVHDFQKQPAGTGDLVVPAGGTLTLRYRVLLHGAGWDRARLDAAWRAFAAP